METNLQNNKKPLVKTFIESVGRRRESTARVRVYPLLKNKTTTVLGITLKPGDFIVNKKSASVYFPGDLNKKAYQEPLVLTGNLDTTAVSVVSKGGGVRGQLGATIHALSRALDMLDPAHHTTLKSHGLLTRDPRMRERRKAGFAQKARAKKQSPKR